MNVNNDLYYQYNPWWEGLFELPQVMLRSKFISRLIESIQNQRIVLLTGLRRVGKTTLMKILVRHLLEQGVEPTHIFYVSLDDYLLRELSIIDIVNEYRKLHRLSFDTKVFAFFDEVTNKVDFQVQLKNLYDNHNVKVFASSSSASAFRDKKGYLTGREQLIEVTPLDFEEYLQFKGIVVKKRDHALLQGYFEDYLKCGGIPEYVLHQNRDYLVELVDDLLYKDIVAFHGIKQPALIKDYFMLLMERVGKQISLTKVANILGISVDSAKRYLNLFVETFLIYLVPRYGKTNETLLSAKKVYAADLGIRNLFTGYRDKGALFENVVFSHIKALRPRYLYQDGIEIDFYTENKILIEVKYQQELNHKQEQLFEAFKANKKIIIKNFDDLKKLDAL